MKLLLAFGVAMIFGPLLLLAPIIGMLSEPWAAFRFSGMVGQVEAAPDEDAEPIDPAIMPVASGGVTDSFRYQLARAAGFNPAEAIIATAISIAEDGSGNPAAMSPKNKNGTFDLGLWQINSIHWAKYGGQQALVDPATNARAAYGIYGPGKNWCAWSTYEAACGVGHNSAYRSYLGRAQAASQVAPLGA